MASDPHDLVARKPVPRATRATRESDLHAHIFSRTADLSQRFPHVALGPGDDCAIVRSDRGDLLLLKVDQLIEHRHFLPGTPIDLIARKAIHRCASDIAAMAGEPMWTLVSVILPEGFAQSDANLLFDRLKHWSDGIGAPLIGGDVARGPSSSSDAKPCALSLSVSMGGRPSPGRGPVLRSTARVGDELWVSGPLGGSLGPDGMGRHLTFTPRIREARWLADTLVSDLHAMMDLSDGLGRDAARMGKLSGVRMEIQAGQIRTHPDAHGAPVIDAIAHGEDYELLIAVSPGAMSRANGEAMGFARIGRVVAGEGCVLIDAAGKATDISRLGYEHA